MLKKILVTGASSGFGKLIVQRLLNDAHIVIATMRGLQSKNKIVAEELKKLGAICLEMDITDEASVNHCIQNALEQAGGIDVIVNNAGVFIIGIQEACTIEDCQKIFDVNVFGAHRVNRAILPHMREKHSGLLIQISSIAGRVVGPFWGLYSASKHALEAMTDSYHVELASLGIESVLIEPGFFKTKVFNNLIRPSDTERSKSYGSIAEIPERILQTSLKAIAKPDTPNDPEEVANAVAQLISLPAGQRPFRTIVDKLGMVPIVEPCNRISEELQHNFYSVLGIPDMLTYKLHHDTHLNVERTEDSTNAATSFFHFRR